MNPYDPNYDPGYAPQGVDVTALADWLRSIPGYFQLPEPNYSTPMPQSFGRMGMTQQGWDDSTRRAMSLGMAASPVKVNTYGSPDRLFLEYVSKNANPYSRQGQLNIENLNKNPYITDFWSQSPRGTGELLAKLKELLTPNQINNVRFGPIEPTDVKFLENLLPRIQQYPKLSEYISGRASRMRAKSKNIPSTIQEHRKFQKQMDEESKLMDSIDLDF